jgi:hypothetical protein
MITFYSSDDVRPDPASLVGKIVGKEGIKPFRSYSLPLLVTGFTGCRLYLKASTQNRDGILPIAAWTEGANMLVRKVFYVCDTVEEATIIHNACHEAQRLHDLAQKALSAGIGELFASVGGGEAGA